MWWKLRKHQKLSESVPTVEKLWESAPKIEKVAKLWESTSKCAKSWESTWKCAITWKIPESVGETWNFRNETFEFFFAKTLKFSNARHWNFRKFKKGYNEHLLLIIGKNFSNYRLMVYG